ncbi:MAG: type II secretion system F family protein [Candidatus Omnitrophica bacterium]|nr:type II secretion system F family protein [Candidatus Omnitrophota bacterium]
MPRFAYRAKDRALHALEGTIEAENEAAALGRLGREGVFPISITEFNVPPTSPLWGSRRISPRTLAYTTHQLADLLSGGLPLLSALALLAKQTEQAGLRRVIESLANAVRDGRSLSEALGAHPEAFPPLYRSMVKAGEIGGGLEQALNRLAELGEHDAELRSRVSSASAYPMFILGIAVAMTVFLMAYVIPKLSIVFIETGQLLPLPTRILLALSAFFTRWWWTLGVSGLLLGLMMRRWHASPTGRAAMDAAVLRIPAVGALLRRMEMARFARTLGVMIGQGVPILQALDVVVSHRANATLQRAIDRVRDAVRDGSSLATALAATGQFPAFVTNMVAVGEESGTVDGSLLKVAGAYERDVDRTMRTLTTILEPVLLLVVGGIVMVIVLAMLLPIFQIGLVVQ